MSKKAKPVTRQDLLNLAVTDADAFQALRFLRHRETIPSIPDLEEQGRESLPGIEGSMLDLYHALWSPEPGVKEEVTPDRRYWKELLGQAMQSSAYQELHANTQFRELQSVLGTISMSESVIGMIPAKDKKQLQDLSQAQQETNDLSEQANQAQAMADAAQQLADAAAEGQGEGEGETGSGKPGQSKSSGPGQMSAEQAKAIANELAEAAAQAKTDAQSSQAKADEAKAKAEAMANDLMGQPDSQAAQDKIRELARIGMQAVKDAQTKVEEVSKTIESWGLDAGELTRQGIPEALGLLERMKRNSSFKKFAELLGRIRKIAARKAKAKAAGDGARISTIETGRDLKRAQRSELVALINPALRVKALQRWTRGELRLFGQKVKQKLGHGPVIVCEDGSGSMDGAKQQWAKAVVLSLAYYAKLQKRNFGWILFDSRVQCEKTYPKGQINAEQMLELVESRAGGGTDFERPLRKAMEIVKSNGFRKADITFLTDGECEVSAEFLKEFKMFKKEFEVNVITVLCDVGSSSDSSITEFSDRIEKASAFTAEEAEKNIFRHL